LRKGKRGEKVFPYIIMVLGKGRKGKKKDKSFVLLHPGQGSEKKESLKGRWDAFPSIISRKR